MPGLSVEYAERVREATLVFTTARSALDVMMRLQFDEAVDRLTGHWDDRDGCPRDEVEFTIGFIDLVDSTRLTVESRRRSRRPCATSRGSPPKPRRGTLRAS